MKQNILIVCYDYDISKAVAKQLANLFSMRLFDQKELFEFDHMPRTFSEVYDSYGKDYILKKMKSIVKMELDFDDAIFVADISFADNCFDMFYKIKLSNFVVLLKKDNETEVRELNNKKYETKEEKEYYSLDANTLKKREFAISYDLADVVIDIENMTNEQIASEIVDKIKNYYSVN